MVYSVLDKVFEKGVRGYKGLGKLVVHWHNYKLSWDNFLAGEDLVFQLPKENVSILILYLFVLYSYINFVKLSNIFIYNRWFD